MEVYVISDTTEVKIALFCRIDLLASVDKPAEFQHFVY